MADDSVNILLVDDRADKLTSLEAVLAELGQNIVKVQSGAEALRVLLRQDFAVILLDVHMPVMDGFETAALIRQRERTERTPIIFITAISAAETHVSRGYSLGAVDYIFAPIVPEILRAKVAVFIELYKKTEQVKRQADWLRAEAERRAAVLETRLQGLLNRLNVGVFRATLDGRFIEANPAFLALVGAASIGDVGPDDMPELRDADTQPRDGTGGERFREGDVRVNRRDGSSIWVRMNRRVSLGPDGEPVIEGLVEDITERKVAEAALTQKAEQLARSNADLEQFAYIASHDLQEPLRTVRIYCELVKSQYASHLDERGRGHLEFAVQAAARMQELVRDMLSYARMKGRERATVTVSAEEVLDRALFNLSCAIEESGATVTHDPLPVLRADAVLFVQLFQNLIGNALKFRGEQPPHVHLSAQRVEEGWEFAIRDNGIGIRPEYHERIFGIFRRLHPYGRYAGTGIGLALCRHIVERHGGRIWVESAEGAGATFRFVLAADRDPAPAASLSDLSTSDAIELAAAAQTVRSVQAAAAHAGTSADQAKPR